MGYWEEKAKFNKCPQCNKGILVVSVNKVKNQPLLDDMLGYKNVFTSFCPICGYTIKKEVKI